MGGGGGGGVGRGAEDLLGQCPKSIGSLQGPLICGNDHFWKIHGYLAFDLYEVSVGPYSGEVAIVWLQNARST